MPIDGSAARGRAFRNRRDAMVEPESEEAVVARAVAGETFALERLLLTYHDRLARRIARKLPTSLQSCVDVEDILQMTYVGAFRDIRTFRVQGPEAFYRWLATIAEHRLLDAIKAHHTAKRRGNEPAAGAAGDKEGSSVAEWLELVAGREPRPSEAAARGEAIRIMQVALAGLPPAYREALRLRYLEGKTVAAVAAQMQRTTGAVLMLCNRGLKKLREALGRASLYLSSR
jgi:RNA polymerase sigma-70 factor (ECF subfamily)